MSVYSTEMMAVIIGVQRVEEVCCANSVAALLSIQNVTSNREDLMSEIQQSLFQLNRTGIEVRLCSVPAHADIKGNEGTDETAKKYINK